MTDKPQKPRMIVFGDIHGSTYWKEIMNENPGCRYIFLGDYLDPYQKIPIKELIDNLKAIIQLKKENPGNVILLLGNHDLHYVNLNEYPCTRFDEALKEEAHALFTENARLFTNAFQVGDCIFTHAGISEKWFLEDFKGDVSKNIADQLNNPLPDQLPALYRCGFMRGGDKNTIGGIFWADIDELNDPLPGFTQIVGHNRVEEVCFYENNNGRIAFWDCLWNKHYLEI